MQTGQQQHSDTEAARALWDDAEPAIGFPEIHNRTAHGSRAPTPGTNPDDFYRLHQPLGAVGHRTHHPPTISEGASDSMAATSRRQPGLTNGSIPPHSSAQSSRAPYRPNLRSVSTPVSTQQPSSDTRTPKPPFVSSGRPSVKALANKFDRPTTTTPAINGKVRRSRTPSASRPGVPAAHNVQTLDPLKEQEFGPPKYKKRDSYAISTTSSASSARRTSTDRESLASQEPAVGSTSIPASEPNFRLDPPHRPPTSTPPLLFGEVDRTNALLSPGHGILGAGHRRRLSESSVHQTAPSFGRSHNHQNEELQATPRRAILETISPDRTSSAGGHRRFYSNFPGAPSQSCTEPPPSIDTLMSPILLPVSFNARSGGASPNGESPRSPVSRIPIPSRRTSAAALEMSSSASTSFASSGTSSPRYPASSPTRERRNYTTARRGKENTPRKPPTTPPPSKPARGRYEPSANKTPTRNQRLEARIKATVPKTSPPLRSARARQQVSRPAGGEAPAGPKEPPDTSAPIDSRLHGGQAQHENNVHLAPPLGPLRLQRGEEHSALGQPGAATQEFYPGFGRAQAEMLPSSAYVGPHEDLAALQSPSLALETNDLPKPSAEEPVTGATEFENDESPILGMPGGFPAQSPVTVTVETQKDNDAETGASRSSLHDIDGATVIDQPVGAEQNSILSHVMRLRANSYSTPRSSPTEFTEDAASEKDDVESIQIMLGSTPTIAEPQRDWDTQDRAEAETERGGNRRLGRAFDKSDPRISHLYQADDAHIQDDQISDGTPALPGSERFTLDRKTYSMVNQILEQYHNSSYVSPEMAFGFQQQIQAMSPDLARHGNWESKEATQVYLEQLLRDAASPAATFGVPQTPPMVEVSLADPTDIRALNASPDDGYTGTAIIYGQPRKYGQISEQATPELEYPPTPPPKDWFTPDASSSQNEAMESTPRTWRDSRPSQPEVEGTGNRYGLAIQVVPMVEPPALPPLPNHSPPPPPPPAVDAFLSPEKPTRLSHSPNGYDQIPPSSSLPPAAFPPAAFPSPAVSATADYEERSGQRSSAYASHSQSVTSLSQEPSEVADAESADHKRLKERRHLVKELLDTEFSHAQDMKIVEDIYKATSTSIDTITDDDRRVLFSNSKEIAEFSEKFISALKPAAASIYTMTKSAKWSAKWSAKRGSVATSHSATTDQSFSSSPDQLDDAQDRKTFIGETFLQNLAAMEKCYGTYIKSHEAANQRLAALQERHKVKVWLGECRVYANDLTTTWDLDSLLVKPTQRLMKYPLILTDLLKRTPQDHPDYKNLETALRELRNICNRINETKKRAELVDQVVNRKRKESDGRLPSGLAKVIGRRTERLKQQVGLTESVDDQDYDAIAQKFGGHFFQLQIVMRDVEKYMEDVQQYVDRCNTFILAIEAFIDVRPGTFPELESKWRRYSMAVREITTIALPEHKAALTSKVINPISTLWKIHDNPQRMMQKRKKRIVDYARYKSMTERGEKPDKRTQETADQFQALNETLKIELPKLYALTKKLIEACLEQFINIQKQWQDTWRRKVNVLDEETPDPSARNRFSEDMSEVVARYFSDFRPVEHQVDSFVICDASQVKELCKMSSPSTSIFTDSMSSTRPPTFSSSKRTQSVNSEQSAILASPVFTQRFSGNFPTLPPMDTLPSFVDGQASPMGRMRAGSALSSRGPSTPRSLSAAGPSYFPARPSTATGRTTEPLPSPSFPRLSLDTPEPRPASNAAYPSANPGAYNRGSSIFSSAMPMSDSPIAVRAESPSVEAAEPRILFLAASLFEFNIAHDRTEGGYPYLRYVPGEIFDVIGQKGELWLARNQDDETRKVGWIWEKHFARFPVDEP